MSEIQAGQAAVAVEGLVKAFPGTLAVNNVSLAIHGGTIHALVGENGAGKSTIIKILSGAYRPESGTIIVGGQPVAFDRPSDAQDRGIVTIHQERTLNDNLTVLENIFLGREFVRSGAGKRLGLVDRPAMERHVRDLMDDFGLPRDLINRPVELLPSITKQVVEIVKALAFRSDLVILDEPTAGVPDHEKEVLFDHLRRIRDRGAAILWVTHQLEDAEKLADVVSVMRDGALVANLHGEEITIAKLVRSMVGRDVESLDALAGSVSLSPPAEGAARALAVKGLQGRRYVRDIGFDVRIGEIVGIGSLDASCLSELARTICGALKRRAGTIEINGQTVPLRSMAEAQRAGLSYLPNERKTQGIFPDYSVAQNISIPVLNRISSFLFVNTARERRTAETFKEQMHIRAHSVQQPISSLSGGNQQKAIIARVLVSNPKVVVLHEPTQGVDIAAKIEIYNLIKQFCAAGGAAIVVSTELIELLSLSQRVLVLRDGAVAGVVPGVATAAEGSSTHDLEEQFMRLAAGTETLQ